MIQDRDKLDREIQENENQHRSCQNLIEVNELNLRKVKGIICDLQNQLEEGRVKIDIVKNAKRIEIEQGKEQVMEAEKLIEDLIKEKEKVDLKVKEQEKAIDVLNSKILEAEYTSKRSSIIIEPY